MFNRLVLTQLNELLDAFLHRQQWRDAKRRPGPMQCGIEYRSEKWLGTSIILREVM